MFPSCEETVNGLFCKKSLITFFSVLVHKYIKFNNVPILIKKKSYYKEKNLLIIILQSKVIDNNFFTYIPPLMTVWNMILYSMYCFYKIVLSKLPSKVCKENFVENNLHINVFFVDLGHKTLIFGLNWY